jgi:hypothetical protein
MRKFFEPIQTDPGLSEIQFTDENKKEEFCLEIIGKTSQDASLLKGRINALKKNYDADTSDKQNFDIFFDEKKTFDTIKREYLQRFKSIK